MRNPTLHTKYVYPDIPIDCDARTLLQFRPFSALFSWLLCELTIHKIFN